LKCIYETNENPVKEPITEINFIGLKIIRRIIKFLLNQKLIILNL